MPAPAIDLSYTPSGFEKGLSAQGRVALEGKALPERYGLLEASLAEAVAKNVISPLPTSEPNSRNEYARSRLKTIRNRLFLLGYIERDSGQAHLGSVLKDGIRMFQQEARLAVTDFSVDGWVGERTWSALQELVSFEEPSNLERWFVQGRACDALCRAIQLRLFAFGLCASTAKKQINRDAIGRDVKHFSDLECLLGFQSGRLRPELCFETVNMLFDQDELVRRLGKAKVLDEQGMQSMHGFILNITKVELWMLGYDHVAPRGYRDLDTSAAYNKRFELKGSLFKALLKFWKDRDDKGPGLKARFHLRKNFPDFFAVLSATMFEADDKLDSDMISDVLEQGIAAHKDEHLIHKIWNQLHAIGARIWDGIKRVWRWFTAKLNDGIAYLKNLSRLAYHLILQSFEAAQSLVTGVVSSLSFFADPVLNFPLKGLGLDAKNPSLIVGKDKDFDFISIVDSAAGPAGIEKMMQYLNNKASMFAVSCKFLACLLDVVIAVIKNSIFVGWPLFLMALLKFYKSIKNWAPAIIASQRAERRILQQEQTLMTAA